MRSTIPVLKLPIPFLSPQFLLSLHSTGSDQGNANLDRASKWLPVGTPVSWFATLVQSHRGGTEADPSHARV
jgi:hypothetical protein